jgi:membrane protease subunit (stomatin/prohibitin family)
MHQMELLTHNGEQGTAVVAQSGERKGRDIDVETMTGQQDSQLDAAELWVLTITEGYLRTLVSQVSTASLISKTATSYLHVEHKHEDRSPLAQVTTDDGSPLLNGKVTADPLAERLRELVAAEVQEYGLEVKRIELQEVSLPEEMQKAVEETRSSMLLPVRKAQEARADQIELQARVDVLGIEAVSVNEAMKNLQGANIFGGDVLGTLLSQRTGKPKPDGAPQDSSAAAKTGGGPAALLPALSGPPVAHAEPVPATTESICKCSSCGKQVKVVRSATDPNQRWKCPHCGSVFGLQS